MNISRNHGKMVEWMIKKMNLSRTHSNMADWLMKLEPQLVSSKSNGNLVLLNNSFYLMLEDVITFVWEWIASGNFVCYNILYCLLIHFIISRHSFLLPLIFLHLTGFFYENKPLMIKRKIILLQFMFTESYQGNVKIPGNV